MNAEALIGTILGTCTLQKLVGQGGMGAVFLAQQSRPRRQVAVKVLLPMTPLSPNQLSAFLERFRRETDAAASLEHPNIMPVHEYGERDGLAYLVMPYISGGTLRDELEREGPLPLPKIANYLEQMAAALDFAHEHGVIHRDIKPANIMVTPEGRLLLTDFGLVKIVTEGQTPQVRLTGAGAPVGTPDYMAPEQVIGEEIDTRADLYSLGVILYQMVTGTTPFQGETPMQIAAQHLQVPPPWPQVLRPELPVAAEQVILRALAKRPADRYMHAQEMASAFRATLQGAGVKLEANYTGGALSTMTSSQLAAPKGQFEPLRQTSSMPKMPPAGGGLLSRTGMLSTNTQSSLPTASVEAPQTPPGGGGLLSRTGKFPMVGSGTGALPAVKPETPPAGGLLSRTGKFPTMGTGTGVLPAASPFASSTTNDIGGWSANQPLLAATETERTTGETRRNTGDLESFTDDRGKEGTKSTIKLTGPAKVVKVPIPGQPGQFATGILPTSSSTQEQNNKQETTKKASKPWMKIALVAAVVLLVCTTAGILWFSRGHSTQNTQTPTAQTPATGKPNPQATTIAKATAAAQANVILADPLDYNRHSWLTTPPDVYSFKNGAYHIVDHEDNNGRATVLPARSFPNTLGYTLTMQEVNGDDTSATNSFGMIFRFNQQSKNGKQVTTFYSFEVVNTKGGEYQFWKYDDSNTDNPWTQIKDGKLPLGDEFHQGHGPQAANTIKIFMDGNKFTVTVNGKLLSKTFQDDALTGGTVGMIVNLKGTEIAFSNLLLTRN